MGESDAWETERTLADAEEEEREPDDAAARETACSCGSSELLLEAYFRVVDGRMQVDPVETESLTCPHCGREYEAVVAEDGRVLRGDFLGYVELE